ncbi:MAG: ABC transporter substrate-binding protein [Actinomycetota bacterium]
MKRWTVATLLAFVLVAAACTGGDDGDTTGATGGATGSTGAATGSGSVELTMWMGYTPPPPENEALENLSLQAIVDRFNAERDGEIHVTMQYVNSDNALQKATVALQGGQAPDISYQYGTNMPQLATAPQLVDLTDRVADPAFDWEDFFEGERAVATVNGKVYGIPALVDNLAIVYNADLFEQAGVPEPTPDWTWDDALAAAKAVTDPDTKTFGMVFPADGSETTVWQYIAMLWAAGGDILNEDNTEAVFNSASGVRALSVLQQAQQDGSLYLDFRPDSGKYSTLFNSGKIGMVITGPWDLSGFPDVNYGVQVMPSFDPGGSHETIAGPDNWVIFDNGPERVDAAWEFLTFLASPEMILQDSLATSHLPTRASVQDMPGFAEFDTKFPGVGAFAANLENVKKARPQIVQYPQVSSFLGQAIVSVLLGEAEPQAALDEAAEQANGVLAVPQ